MNNSLNGAAVPRGKRGTPYDPGKRIKRQLDEIQKAKPDLRLAQAESAKPESTTTQARRMQIRRGRRSMGSRLFTGGVVE